MTGLVLFAVLVAALVVVVLVRRPQTAVLPGSPAASASTSAQGTDDDSDSRGDAASALLARLVGDLRDGTGDIADLAAPGDPAAVRELRTLRANVRALGLTGLSMRYVDEDSARVDPAEQQRLGGQAWVGDVQMAWRIGGWDARDSRLEVTMTFVQTADGARFVSARDDHGRPAPLWLLTGVQVQHSGRALVLAAGGPPTRYSGLADQAVIDVHKVLPRWRGRLVVEVPANPVQLGRVLGSEPDTYGGIAAVTTTVDGSRVPDAPTHIFVNRPVFDPLGPRGSQIVMSHEATHVATGAATSRMPTWLLEGFADFVALDHMGLPVSVTASQILASVRKNGPPAQLPGPKQFDPKNQALGASYEAAWLACRLLGQKYGERRLIAFYRAADRTGSTSGPFRTVLGTDQRTFTRQWRGYLRQLAGASG